MSIFFFPKQQAFGTSGGISPGAKLYFYAVGTTTPKNTYSDSGLTTPHSNPVVADSSGVFAAIYLSGNYKVVLKTSSDVTLWTQDNYNASDAAALSYVVGNNTRPLGSKLGDFISVHDYGAVGDGATNDTAAIIAACAAIQANGGGTLIFDPKTYLIYPNGTLSGAITMATFSGLDGVCIDGRGATLTIGDTFAGSETVTHFKFTTCRNVEVKNFSFVQTIATPITSLGQRPIYLQYGSVNFHAHNIYQYGGLSGFVSDRVAQTQDRATYLCHNITLNDWYCESVGYPLSFQNNGDDVTVWNFDCVGPGRAYFPYGVRNHNISIRIKDGSVSPACNLTTGITADSNFLEDIRLHVESTDNVSTTQANLIDLNASVSQATPLAANIRNIHVTANANLVTAAPLNIIFSIGKYVTDVGVDATDRGHLIENVSFGGTITNASNRGEVVSLMKAHGTWGSGETVRNLSIRDLVIEGTATTAIAIDLDPVVDYFSLENVRTPSALSTQGTAQYGILYRNCTLGSVVWADGVNLSVQTLTGAGAVDLTHRVTHVVSTGANALTLADGSEGQRKTIVMITDAGDATLTPTNFAGNPSNTITFNDVGDTAELFFTNGSWHFMGGTATVA